MRNKAIRVKTNVRAGGITINHSRSGLKVRAAVRAGGIMINHTRGLLSA